MDFNEKPTVYKPLKRRFYILFAFCIYSYVCGIIWNSWQPLNISIRELYHWSNTEINLLNNINALVVCVLIFPFILLWNKFGIKFCYTTSSCIILIGCIIRVFPCDYHLQAILLQVGNAISAYGQLMAYVGATSISALWFPTSERSRSTCTALAFSTLGSVTAPLAAANFVPTFKNMSNPNARYQIKLGIQKFMFLHCAIAMFGLVLIIIYFPSKPKYLPCKSSEKDLRIDLKTGCKMLIKNKQFWIVFVFNLITSGIISGVISVLPSIIEPLGISQKENGVIIALGNLCVFISSIIGGYLGDKISYKKIVLYSIPPTIATFVLFGLQSMRIIRHDSGSIYAVVLVMLFVSNITSNISFEMACEVSFPASEEVTTAVTGFGNNLGIVIFLSVTMITDKNVTWIPYSYAALMLIVIPLMIFYDDERKRFNCDYGFIEEGIIQLRDDSEDNYITDVNDEYLHNDLENCSMIRFPQ